MQGWVRCCKQCLLVSNEGEGLFDMFSSLPHSKLVVWAGFAVGGQSMTMLVFPTQFAVTYSFGNLFAISRSVIKSTIRISYHMTFCQKDLHIGCLSFPLSSSQEAHDGFLIDMNQKNKSHGCEFRVKNNHFICTSSQNSVIQQDICCIQQDVCSKDLHVMDIFFWQW